MSYVFSNDSYMHSPTIGDDPTRHFATQSSGGTSDADGERIPRWRNNRFISSTCCLASFLALELILIAASGAGLYVLFHKLETRNLEVDKLFEKLDKRLAGMDAAVVGVSHATSLKLDGLQLQGNFLASQCQSQLDLTKDQLKVVEGLVSIVAPTTCEDVRRFGVNSPGQYVIKPKGAHEGGLEPVEVRCEFTGGKGVTVVSHDKQDVTWYGERSCDQPDCLSFANITYTVSPGHIEAIVAEAEYCEQDLYESVSRERENDISLLVKCNSTTTASTSCEVIKSGYLKDPQSLAELMEQIQDMKLPIRSLQAPTNATMWSNVDGIQVGPLKCYGDRVLQASTMIPGIPTEELKAKVDRFESEIQNFPLDALENKLAGLESQIRQLNGSVQTISKDVSQNLESDLRRLDTKLMDQQRAFQGQVTETSSRLDRHLGTVRDMEEKITALKSGSTKLQNDVKQVTETIAKSTAERNGEKVAFDLVRLSKLEATSTVITYNQTLVNIGNAITMDKGVFTAPSNGIYYFGVNFHERNGVGDTTVNIRVDENSVSSVTVHSTDDDWGTHGQETLVKLTKGQKVDAFLKKGGIWADGNANIRFIGFMLFSL